MWYTIAILTGVVIGFSLKDTLKNNFTKVRDNIFSSKRRTQLYRNTSLRSKSNDSGNITNDGFSLQSISGIFTAYGVGLTNLGSFYFLRKKIENSCYKNLLKKFADGATSADKLVKMLNEELVPTFDVNISYSNQPPYIYETKLDEYIVDEGTTPTEIGTVDNKVKFLLSISYAHGIKRFKDTLGVYLTEFLEAAEKGENVEDLYNEIMKIIKTHYEYVS